MITVYDNNNYPSLSSREHKPEHPRDDRSDDSPNVNRYFNVLLQPILRVPPLHPAQILYYLLVILFNEQLVNRSGEYREAVLS